MLQPPRELCQGGSIVLATNQAVVPDMISKDLSQLGRPIADTIIIDNSPASYIFHPNNAVPVSSWFNDPHDTELTDLCPFLADLSEVDDVRGVLDGGL